MLSIGITLAFGLGIGSYYKLRSKNVIKIREESKKLEREFGSALFQLGSRLGSGIPSELAFGRVAESMKGTRSGKFFELVDRNIRSLGMGVESAIFDKKRGAILSFPSNLIESSMKVLVESAKKGPKVAAHALMNVSEYIREIHRVDERLKDLLADVISGMKSQVKFMVPVISAIVIGITSMITNIMGALAVSLSEQQIGEAGVGVPSVGALSELFSAGIPTFYFQIL